MTVAPLAELYRYQRAWLDDPAPRRIWTKARGIGASWTIALESVLRAAGMLRDEPAADVIIVSTGLRASRELVRLARMHALAVETATGRGLLEGESLDDLRLAGGHRVIGLPGSAEPRAVRGYRGHVVADEAAWSVTDALWRALEGCATPTPGAPGGYSISLITTAGSTGSLAYRIATGSDPGWSRHQTTLEDAQGAGAPVDAEQKRREVDARTFAREYMGVWGADEGALLDAAALDACEDASPVPGGRRLLALDVGRSRDASALLRAAVARDEVVHVTGATARRSMPWADQRRWIRHELSCAPGAVLWLDATGVGQPHAEELQTEHGRGRVRPVTWTRERLLSAAESLRHRVETGRLRIAPDAMHALRPELLGVRLEAAGVGLRVVLPRGGGGHSDLAAAMLVLEHAVGRPSPSVWARTGGESASARIVDRALGLSDYDEDRHPRFKGGAGLSPRRRKAWERRGRRRPRPPLSKLY